MYNLRHLFEAMGFANVETFIASGNVIFDSTSKSTLTLQKKIEDQLQAALGYEVATFVRSMAELAEIAQYKPFADAELNATGNTVYIAFVADRPGDTAEQQLRSFTTRFDEFHVHGREIYWLCRRKMSESEFSSALLEKILGRPATLRNSTTIKRLASKYT